MGVAYNSSSVVTNGLVFCLDMANPHCNKTLTQPNRTYSSIYRELFTKIEFPRATSGIDYLDNFNQQGIVIVANSRINIPNCDIIPNGLLNALNVGSNPFTVMIWHAFETSVTTKTAAFACSEGPAELSIERAEGDNFLQSRSGTTTLSFPTYTLGKFHCYAFTKSGTTLINYFDGEQSNSTNSASNPGNLGLDSMVFGILNFSDMLFGSDNLVVPQRIGWFGVYNRALSAAEIKRNYNVTRDRYSVLQLSYNTSSYSQP